MAKRGLEEIGNRLEYQDYLCPFPGGRFIILRGKYKGAFVDTIPRGYIRKFVLTKWVDDMTPKEREVFERLGEKEEDDGQR